MITLVALPLDRVELHELLLDFWVSSHLLFLGLDIFLENFFLLLALFPPGITDVHVLYLLSCLYEF